MAKKNGLCIHKMIGGELDSGDIIARDYYPLKQETTITDVFEWMHKRTVDLFIEAINQLVKDPQFIIEAQSKSWKDALRVYPRLPEDGLINWDKSAIEVLRLVNATNKPFSGAYSFIDNTKAIIWRAEIVEDFEIFQAIPGQVLKLTDSFVDVATSDMKKIRVKELEIEGVLVSPLKHIKSIRKRFKSQSF